jgi:hypothetical protein
VISGSRWLDKLKLSQLSPFLKLRKNSRTRGYLHLDVNGLMHILAYQVCSLFTYGHRTKNSHRFQVKQYNISRLRIPKSPHSKPAENPESYPRNQDPVSIIQIGAVNACGSGERGLVGEIRRVGVNQQINRVSGFLKLD